MKVLPEGGRSFEDRALDLARAIHDPLGLQGPVMHKGRERDGLFISPDAITAYEFSQLKTKDKATKDAEKLAELLADTSKSPENKYKGRVGYFVTQGEPTAEQRSEVMRVASSTGSQIHAISFATLKKRLIDVEGYIRARDQAPFGSADFAEVRPLEQPRTYTTDYVNQSMRLAGQDAESLGTQDLAGVVGEGGHIVVLGDYGVGKSEALRQCYQRLRKQYFKSPDERRIPVHINLRDMYGLRTAAEVFRRHAESIGFGSSADQLISAWRAGSIDLILDGFDELIPARWAGGARDLPTVRKGALACVREIVMDTPSTCGVLVAGRAQYFSSREELRSALSVDDARIFEILDFDDTQLGKFVGGGGSASLSAFVPRRPLLLKFVMDYMEAEAGSEGFSDRGEMWHVLLGMVARREADRLPSVTADSISRLISQVSVMCRRTGDVIGPITVAEIGQAFADVCGYQPDEEGMQLVMRLPGLASGDSGGSRTESRKFIDVDLAEAAFGYELADYAMAPHHNSSLGEAVGWQSTGDGLGVEVAAARLNELNFAGDHLKQALKHRRDKLLNDAVTLDLLRLADQMECDVDSRLTQEVREVIVPHLIVDPNGYLELTTFTDCIVEELNLSNFAPDDSLPRFANCLIGAVLGVSEEGSGDAFEGSQVASFERSFATLSGIVDSDLPAEVIVAISILKKVYVQKGAARKESALVRGLPLQMRQKVPSVLSGLVSAQFVTVQSRRSVSLVSAVPTRRDDVSRLIAQPPKEAFW